LIPIADCHSHTNPVSGLGMKSIAKRFAKVGGWFIAIVSLPPSHYGYPPTLEGYVKSFELLLREARVAREHGLKVATFIGMHPADVEKQILKLGIEKTLALADSVMKVIERYLSEGKVSGLGEFGRPHYRTLPEAFAINEYLMVRALEVARDYGKLIHLHLEQRGEVTALSLAKISDLVNVPRDLIIVHHADTRTAVASSRRGFLFTALGRIELIKSILEHPPNLESMLMESDHIDDPRRPGVALYPWQLRDCIDNLLELGYSDEMLHRVMVDNVAKTFNVEPP